MPYTSQKTISADGVPTRLNRRAFLAGSTAVGTSAVAGCTGFLGDDEFELCHVSVLSLYETADVEVTIRVDVDGEPTVERSAVVDARENGAVDGFAIQDDALPGGWDEYRVAMRVGDDEWERLDASDVGEDRTAVEGRISQGGRLTVFSSPELCDHIDYVMDQ